MRKALFIGFAALLAVLALAAPVTAAKAPLVVAMRDPGCHWFLVNGKYTKTAVAHGSVTLLNRDEATLKVKGPSGTRMDKVGAKLTISAKGTYHLTMVGQAPDDNTLTLRVR